MPISYVPTRFATAVALHVLRNIAVPGAELILGIQGPPGEGKTFQCSAVLERLGVAVVTISGNEFESRHAGRPAELLISRYQYASRLVLSRKAEAAVLFINDIDAGIGNFGELVQYTVNTQQINAVLMAMCDFPLRVGDEDTARVPVLVTANDLTKLYAPLTRPGRMSVFTWCPTVTEKVAIIAAMYSGVGIELATVRRLVRAHPRKPVAFFRALMNRVLDVHLESLIRTEGLERVITAIRSRAEIFSQTREVDAEHLTTFARELAATQRVGKFLKGAS